MTSSVLSIIGYVFIGLGLAFFTLAVFGVFKFGYVLNRMHAAAICDGLALGLIVIGALCLIGGGFPALKLVLLIALLFFTSPVSAHLIVGYEIETNELIEEECEVPHE